eukprot:PhF_6_TR27950/c0_g1_i1/m.41236
MDTGDTVPFRFHARIVRLGTGVPPARFNVLVGRVHHVLVMVSAAMGLREPVPVHVLPTSSPLCAQPVFQTSGVVTVRISVRRAQATVGVPMECSAQGCANASKISMVLNVNNVVWGTYSKPHHVFPVLVCAMAMASVLLSQVPRHVRASAAMLVRSAPCNAQYRRMEHLATDFFVVSPQVKTVLSVIVLFLRCLENSKEIFKGTRVTSVSEGISVKRVPKHVPVEFRILAPTLVPVVARMENAHANLVIQGQRARCDVRGMVEPAVCVAATACAAKMVGVSARVVYSRAQVSGREMRVINAQKVTTLPRTAPSNAQPSMVKFVMGSVAARTWGHAQTVASTVVVC